MKKLVLPTCLFAVILALSACGESAHEHTFSSEFSKNDLVHWRVATCGHNDVTKDLGAHLYGDDNKCTICGFSKPAPAHEHTFDREWSKDNEKHWHIATCEHTELTKDLAAHTYGDDGVCTACGFVKPADPHEHTFSNEWSSNDLTHWHAATCEHTDLTKDLANHNYDSDGFCRVCGSEDPKHFRGFVFNGTNCTMIHGERYHYDEEITLQIVADEGYFNPISVDHIGLRDFQYDQKSGLVKGRVMSDVIITATAIPPFANTYISKVVSKSDENTTTNTYTFDVDNNKVIEESRDEDEHGGHGLDYHDVYTYSDDHLSETFEHYRIEDAEFNLQSITYRTYRSDFKILTEKKYNIVDTVPQLASHTCRTYDQEGRLLSSISYNDEAKSSIRASHTYIYYDWGYEYVYWFGSEQLYETHEITYDFISKTSTDLVKSCTGGHRDQLKFKSETTTDLTIQKEIYYKSIYSRTYYTYNENGDMVEYVSYPLEGSEHEDLPIERRLFTYDDSGYFVREIFQDFNVEQEEYEDPWRDYQVTCDLYGYINEVVEYYRGELKSESTYENTLYNGEWIPQSLKRSPRPGSYPDLLNW